MFDVNQGRYATKTVQNIIPLELQQFLWLIIDCRKAAGDRLDYLQVFELRSNHEHQLVCNTQESPPLQLEYKFKLNSKGVINCNVWVIDNGKYATMLLPSDY
ncbi:TPA: hypothetical protein QCY76_003883 [Bacillus cereus]|uniref:DUF960 family protein n=1 Tax=Bacillus TaxID=1386 RepID=UPI001F38BFF8|nr:MULTISPECIES: DUF960 family protein [Bacillus]MCT1383715.1 DUF960 domain-containing protein [Bacillus sp. p3-SID196]HDR8087734.1 hypothetical protein [Bacillus cereus]HDX9523514.1 hypothetical protein [Bacillus cereus]HDX9583651.1 hypothetical protein [Bacillus cereus]